MEGADTVLCIYCAINLDDCRFVLISVNIRFVHLFKSVYENIMKKLSFLG